MAQIKRRQIKYKQKIKRRAKRASLKKKGFNPDEHYVSGICLGMPKR